MKASRAPRLRVVLLVVNLVILLLPLGGIWMLRLHETTLLQQTESELIAQTAFIGAMYKGEVARELERRSRAPSDYGVAIDPRYTPTTDHLQPIPPKLDRAADTILPPAPEPDASQVEMDEIAALAGEGISPVMQEAQRTTLAGMRLVDWRGTVVASSRGEVGMSLARREEVRRALQGERVRVMRERVSDEPSPPLESISRGTRVRVFVALPVVVEGRVWGVVMMSRTPVDVGKALYTIRGYLIAAAVVLLLVVLLVSRFTSLTIVRPVEALIKQTERVSRGERGAAKRLERPVTFEVSQLSEAIALMAAALEERASYIDTFASNVSHEFKTPLTSIRGTVELLRDHLGEMTESERDRFLSNLEEDAERLGRLVSRLQELARADVLKPGEVSASADEVVAVLVERARADGARIEVERVAEGQVQVRMARETLESVLHNLIDNARQHGGEGVSLVVSLSRSGERVLIEVRDDGPGISAANMARVFDRFFTTARDSGGSGLGLSIVKALIEAHGGTLSLRSKPGETVFSISLLSN